MNWTGSPIAGTNAQTLYATARSGLWSDFSYAIPVPNGSYNLVLKFAEQTVSARGARVFNVIVNDSTVLRNFDILAETGRQTALDKSFPVNVTDGQLRILVQGVVGRGILSGIEILPATGPPSISVTPETAGLESNQTLQLNATVTALSDTRLTWSSTAGSVTSLGMFTAPAVTSPQNITVTASSVADPTVVASAVITVVPAKGSSTGIRLRINAGGWEQDYTAPDGTVWLIDRDFSSGDIFYSPYSVAGTSAQMVYRTARYGLWSDFSYHIPLPNGSYNLTMKFTELKYGARGERIFNVVANGITVLKNFDILAETQRLTALDKTFPVSVTDGFLNLLFQGVSGRAMVSGIEIASSESSSPQPQPTSPLLTVSPSSLSFSGTSGSSDPGAQNLSISNGSGGAVNWVAVPSHGWIQLSQTSGSALQVAVGVSMSGMSAGAYRGSVTISADGATNSPITIPVSLTITAPPDVSGNQFFVAPNGSSSGDGSSSRPWNLATALNHPSSVKPGDTICMRGGIYRGIFSSRLTGTSDKPVILRACSGERATIDGALSVNGAHAWYWGFEVMKSAPNRSAGGTHHDAIAVFAPGTKFINLVVHDGDTDGFGFWLPATDSEIYGSLVYYHGYQGPDRGHGHGIYTQNSTGTKVIAENIVFDQFGMNIHGYSSGASYVRGYDLEGNIAFNAGSIQANGNNVDNVIFASGNPLERIRLENNYTYHTPAEDDGYSRLGWPWSGTNNDIIARNNYWMGGESSVEMWNWNNAVYTGNVVYSKSLVSQLLRLQSGQSPSNYTWDNNTYYGSGIFSLNGSTRDWASWKSLGRIDANSRYVPGRPTGVWTFVRPNKYEKGRAHIVVYNWDLKDAVSVDVAGVLSSGEAYEVRDAQNFFGTPVATGTYNGAPIQINMKGLTVAQPIGSIPISPKHTGPEFGAFVLIAK